MNILCFHQKRTTPRRDKLGEYCRCLECGGRLPWSWPDDPPIPTPKLRHSITSSLDQFAMKIWKAEKKSA